MKPKQLIKEIIKITPEGILIFILLVIGFFGLPALVAYFVFTVADCINHPEIIKRNCFRGQCDGAVYVCNFPLIRTSLIGD